MSSSVHINRFQCNMDTFGPTNSVLIIKVFKYGCLVIDSHHLLYLQAPKATSSGANCLLLCLYLFENNTTVNYSILHLLNVLIG